MAGAKWPKKFYRVLKELGVFGYNKKKNLFGIHPLIVSTAFIALTLVLANWARKLVKNVFGESESIVKYLLLEFIATLELCAACFELIIVADNWGIETYAIYLFGLTIWWSKCWESSSACPYSPMEEVLEKVHGYKRAIAIVVSQILGSLVTFRYVQILWSLELVQTHRGKAFEDCSADLQVNMILGALIEAGGTFLCRFTSKTLSQTGAKFAGILDAFFATMMVVAAFNLSGGYFNPALATGLKLGCEGNTLLEHMVVYWLGACAGSLLSVVVFRSAPIQAALKAMKSPEPETTKTEPTKPEIHEEKDETFNENEFVFDENE